MNAVIEQILELGFLGAVAKEDLLSLKPAPDLLSMKTGETLLWQGEPGQAYFLLLRGRLRRFVDDEHGGRRFVGDVVPGYGVGAAGILSDEGNAATVRVMHDSELVRFPRATFLQMMVLSWEFAISVSREQIERVRAAAAPEGRHPTIKNIAVVPLDSTVDQRRFVEELAEAIEPMASVVALDQTFLETQTESDAATSNGRSRMDSMVNRLEAFERLNDIVMYQAALTVDAWTRLVFSRADLVLLITSVNGTTEHCDVEKVLIAPREDELLPRIDLVVMHGSDWSRECGTRDWLDIRHVDEWHHLRNGRSEDFRRLARLLTGNAITLVLGGGGARALGEIGAYKALREAGVPIDRVAGTSMGALIGGLLASGKDPDSVVAGLRKWIEEGKPGKDYTFPALSLVHGKRLHDATHELLGDGNIEDLPITFFCMSSDLSENKAVVHDRGSLWRSVRASISLPGIGPPLFDNGRILVDGALVNNVPAEVAAMRYPGRIIVVDVSLPRKRAVPEAYNDLVPSGWQILWHRINPFLEPLRVPSIYEVLLRSTMVGGSDSHRRAHELANLLIQPPVSGVGLIDFHGMDRLIEIAYEHTIKQLASMGGPALQKLFPGLDVIEPDAAPVRDAPPIDRALFNEILGVDDDEAFREMVGLFIEVFPSEIESVAEAVAADDPVRIRERAHRARSAAANVAAPALTMLLRSIEDLARDGEIDELPERIDKLRAEFRRIEAYMTE